MWLVAGMFRLLGVTPLALRLPSAIAGILTAVATYWLGRELVACLGRLGTDERTKDESDRTTTVYQSIRHSSFVPLVAALYLATSYWHIHFSRFGIRGVFTPLFGALAFAAFWRAVNRREQGRGQRSKVVIRCTSAPPLIRHLRLVRAQRLVARPFHPLLHCQSVLPLLPRRVSGLASDCCLSRRGVVTRRSWCGISGGSCCCSRSRHWSSSRWASTSSSTPAVSRRGPARWSRRMPPARWR